MYKESDILCPLCRKESDRQPHMLKCDILRKNFKSTDICEDSIDYNDLFEGQRKQKKITSLFNELITMRKQILDKDQQSQLDPCNH